MDFIVPKTPWELPAYRDAVGREGFVREAAFQEVTENVAGFECRPLRLRDYLALRATQHPLLIGGEVSPGQLLGFLWLLSPGYDPSAARLRKKFYRRSGLVPPKKPLLRLPGLMRLWRWRTLSVLERAGEVLSAARAYIDEALQDWPGSTMQGQDAVYYGEGVAICARLGREYGWAEDLVLDLPMKRVLQYVKEIVSLDRGPAALANPSDQVKADFIRQYQEFAKTQRTATHAGGKP